MTLTYTIGGVTMTGSAHFIAQDSATLTDAIGQRNTCTFRVVSTDGSFKPTIGAVVTVTDDSSVVRFGGNIRQLKVTQFGSSLIAECGCASYEQLFDRRPTGYRAYTDQTAGDIFQDLLTNCMGGEGLSASIVVSGPVIPSIVFDFISVREAYDQLVAISSDDADTYMWDCTPGKVTRFFRNDSFAAPFNITDSSTEVLQIGGSSRIAADWSFDKYCNRVFPRMSQLIGDPETETFAGDGAQQVFTLQKPVALTPTVRLISEVPDVSADVTETVYGDGVATEFYLSHKVATVTSITSGGSPYTLGYTVNSDRLTDGNVTPLASGASADITYAYFLDSTTGVGVDQTAGERDIDTGKDWYWQKNSADIAQAAGGTPLTLSQSLQVTYQGFEERVLPAVQNDTEVAARAAAEGGTGYYTYILPIDIPGTAADAATRAQAWLDKYSRVPCVIEYPTQDSGVRAGQHQSIANTALGISATFTLEAVTMTQLNGEYVWRVRAVSGAMTGDFKMRLRELKQTVNVTALSATVTSNAPDFGYDVVPLT